jgi:photosystem II stability/assembly factor-like uncharacterized protein
MHGLPLRGAHLPALLAGLVPLLLAGALLSGASAGVNTPHSGWYSGNPLLGPNQLNDLACSGQTCYAAGSFGTLLKSSDAGATWSGIVTGLTAGLVRVRLAGGEPQRVVTGGGCALRRSDDGGETFLRLPFTASDTACPAQVLTFAFPTADVGYLFLSGGAVLSTADGGRTFTRRTAVPGAGPTDVDCVGADTCFVTSGGTIQRTGDGGVSWTQVHAGTPALNSIDAADAKTLYAVGNGLTVLKSEDAGATWKRKEVKGTPSGDLGKVRCGSLSTCLIVTRGSALLRTADGGESFASVVPSTDQTLAVEFASASRALAAGMLGSAEVSNDGGATWVAVGSRIPGAFRVLHAASPSVAYAGGLDGVLARTVDGGQRWRNVSPPTSSVVAGIAAPTAERVFVLASDGSLQRSDNGGASYKLLNAGRMPRAIVALDADRVLLVGPVGIRRSTDAGERFSSIVAKPVRNAVLRGADRAGSAVVAYGPRHLLVSTDRGSSWRALSRPKRRTIRDASFASAAVGYVLDGGGRLWRTRNGGRTWAELESLGTHRGYRLAFADARNGYVAVASFARQGGGYVLRTSDGGERWRPQLVGLEAIETVETSAGTAYALAGSSSLYATTSGGDTGASRTLSLSTTRRTLPKPGRVTIAGRLGSAVGGERVAVSMLAGGRWTQFVATVTSNGSFATHWLVRKRAAFVAQVLGDADHVAAGTAPLTVIVKPKPKRK